MTWLGRTGKRTYRRMLTIAATVPLFGALVTVAPLPTAAMQQCPQLQVCVDSPAYRSTISGSTINIEFNAPGMDTVWGMSWHAPDAGHPEPQGYEATFDSVTSLPPSGSGTLTFPAGQFAHGPITVVLRGVDDPQTATDHAYLQLYNNGGVVWNEGLPGPPPQAGGMDLVFADDFTGPLSISNCGTGATYNSRKADGTGYSQAYLADYEGPNNPFANPGNEYLRMRNSPAPPELPKPWIGGNITSLRCDGTGVAATYGYFEARILAPSGNGTWPAFWFLSKDHIVPGVPDEGEVDGFEGYGHKNYICQAIHWWSGDALPSPTTQCDFNHEQFGPGDNYAKRFHVYGVRISETDIIWYVDGQEVWRKPTFDGVRGPMYFLISQAMGGGWPIDLSRYNNGADMYVDWVRVYEPNGMPPVEAPVGHTIRIKPVAGGGYVEANSAKPDAPLEATVSSPGESTKFIVEDAGNGNVHLKSVATGAYVRPNTAKTAAPLEAAVASPSTATEFTWEAIGGGSIRLNAEVNDDWVSVRLNETDNPLKASIPSNPGGWTEFTWDDLGIGGGGSAAPVGHTIRIQAANGNYVRAIPTEQQSPLRADITANPGAFTTFAVEDAGNEIGRAHV